MSRRARFLPFALPDLDGSELREIQEVLESGWITTGAKTRAFEEEFARMVGASHVLALNSCAAITTACCGLAAWGRSHHDPLHICRNR
jgi:dTDP-4-amino-4,6-dideoxygalactose transaminase